MNLEEQEELKRKQLIYEIISVSFDRAHTYTTVVIFGGYAAFFASWGFLNSYFEDFTRIYSIIAMLLSVTIFVFWELYKMVSGSYVTRKQAECLAFHGVDFNRKIAEFQEFEKSYSLKVIRAWYIVLLSSISFALVALFLFIIGVFSISVI